MNELDVQAVAALELYRYTGSRVPITWDLAGQWFPDACVLFDRDVAPQGWDARLAVERLTTPRSVAELLRADGPVQLVLWADDAACSERMHRGLCCRCVRWNGERWRSRIEIEFAVGMQGKQLRNRVMVPRRHGKERAIEDVKRWLRGERLIIPQSPAWAWADEPID